MNKKMKGPAANAAGENKRPLLVSLRYYRGFYLMFLPVLVFALVFHYLPMLGIRYAFYSYKGIKEPVFIGLAHFQKMMNMPGFWNAFGSTITLSIVKLLLNTIMAVVLSLMLNELRSVTLSAPFYVMGCYGICIYSDSFSNQCRSFKCCADKTWNSK